MEITNRQTQRETVQNAIAANIKALTEQLENGHSETLTAYLAAMSRFHRYSFGNILEIASQRPDATRVAGIRTWNQFGRRVKKGERGIRIFAPIIRQKDECGECAEQDATRKRANIVTGFRAVYIFDLSQTDGEELPEPAKATGEAGGYREMLFDFLNRQGIELEYNEVIAPAQGASYGGRIALLPGQSPAEELATLIHETARVAA